MGKLTTTSAGVSPTDSICRCLLVAGLALTSFVSGQSASNFDPKILPPVITAPASIEKSAKATAVEAGPVSTSPSRYVGPAEMEAYINSMSSVFMSRERVRDPFGQNQDPEAKPVIKASAVATQRRVAPVQITPFIDIVRLITITTIMPGEKRFLVGTRSIRQGDQIPLNFNSKQIRVQVMEVTSRQIMFRNLDTGELAPRKLDLLPPGMTPGSQGIVAPGMIPDRPDAPLELGSMDTAP